VVKSRARRSCQQDVRWERETSKEGSANTGVSIYEMRFMACRVSKVETELSKLRESESDSLQRAAAAQGKSDVLQKALQKAEERAANLEFQVPQHPSFCHIYPLCRTEIRSPMEEV